MQEPAIVDHLIYGTSDLDQAVDQLEELTGVRAAYGGQHLGHGTHNALLALGPAMYLEIMGPDPKQPDPQGPRWLGIDNIASPHLITWAARTAPLEAAVQHAAARGLALGKIQRGGRHRPDGSELRWHLTDPTIMPGDGLVPFLIDWGDGPHPSDTAPGGARLVSLRVEHPDPSSIAGQLRSLNIDLVVSPADHPALVATLECPAGTVELR